MKDLIKALTILSKYSKAKYPIQCEHDIMFIVDVDPDDVSQEDKDMLEKLHFEYDKDMGFYSNYYGCA